MTIASKRTDVPVLEVKNLTITHAHDAAVLVGPLSLTIHSGECLAIVGDSGSGKSLTLKALMGLLPSEMLATTEGFLYRGQHVNELSVRGWNALRGAEIALVQQDTGLALDPLSRVEREVREAAWVHARRARTSTRQLDAQFVTQQLLEAGLSHPEQFLRRWPHQLSGGQRQRVVLASSLSADPALLLADEPTTALDESVQHTVLTRLEAFTRAGGAVLLVSHDEAVVRRLAHRVLYLESGRLHDHRTREAIRLGSLQSPLPLNSQDEPKPPVCDARDLSFTYLAGAGIRDVSIQLHAGRIVGLLGASGSGKTTLAKALTGLLPGVQGTITLDSLDWLRLPERVRRRDRWRLQWVPQDALASFPRGMSVAGLLDEALRCRGLASSRTKASGSASLRDHIRQQRSSLLTAVGLDQNLAHRRPSTLSGGQRQRVAIARALAARPHVLICDESVSALDARSKLGILELLRTVATRDGCAVLFISHDEGAVRQIADRVLMMRDGRLLDTSDSEFSGETR